MSGTKGKSMGTFSIAEVVQAVLNQWLGSASLMVDGAKVICTAFDGCKSNSCIIKSEGGVNLQSGLELSYKDIAFEPLFEKCMEGDQVCKPEIENEQWQDYDETHKTGDGEYALIKDKSYMLCTKGFGVIYATEDGQRKHSRELEIAEMLFKRWIDDPEKMGYLKGMLYCLFSKDPVNLSTGNFIYQRTDLSIHGIMPLEFKRFYNALDNRKGCLGEGWIHNYEMYLEIKENKIILFLDDGREEQYRKVSDGLYKNDHTGMETIEIKNEFKVTTYVYTTPQKTTHVFDVNGKEVKRNDRNGNQICFEYNEAGRLNRAESNSIVLNYEYNAEGYLSKVWDHTNRELQFEYQDGCLVKVINVDGTLIQYAYDSNRKIQEITNPRGIKSVRNEFDNLSRTVKQTFSDGGEMSYIYDDENHNVTMIEQNGNRVTHYYDQLYRTTKTAYDNGYEEFEYNKQNKKTLYEDKKGNITRYFYDEKGNQVKVVDALGNRLHKSYNKDNQLLTISINGITKVRNQYDKNGNLIKTTDGIKRSNAFVYNQQGLPITFIQRDGSKLLFNYDKSGNLSQIIDPEGYRTSYRYDELNRVVETVDANGNSTKFEYDNRNNLIKVLNAEGRGQQYTYNESNKVTSFTDFDGGTWYQEYGYLNKPQKIIDPMGNETVLEYDLMWNVYKRTEANGGETYFYYNQYNLLESVVSPIGGRVSYEYDENGNRTKIIGPLGEVTEISYDDVNRVSEVKEANGAVNSYEYDDNGNIVTYVNGMGSITRFEYDMVGQKTKEIDPMGNVTLYSYNLFGQIIQIEKEGIRLIKHEYDSRGLLVKTEYLDGKYEIFEYDGNRNLIKKKNHFGYEIEYKYDKLNRIISIRSNQGQENKYEYDLVGNLISMTNTNGYTTRYSYDLCGKLVSVIDGGGNQTAYKYDQVGDLIKIVQVVGRLNLDKSKELWNIDINEVIQMNKQNKGLRVTTYKRNQARQVETIIDALGNIETYAYDISGRVIQKKDRDNYLTCYKYTDMGNIEQIAYADGRRVKMQYNLLLQLVEMEDWLGITRIENDALGRATKVTDYKDRVVTYTWGANGEQESIIYPNGKRVNYKYDNHLLLKEVNDGGMQVSYLYNNYGSLVEKVFNSGQKTKYNYNDMGRLKELEHWNQDELLDQYEYTYDALSNKVGTNRMRKGLEQENGRYSYGYDNLNRLNRVSKNDILKREYTYDSFGNRTKLVEGNKKVFYNYNIMNQLISTVSIESNQGYDVRSIEEQFQYDKRGNLTEIKKDGKITNKYQFCALNRLEKAMNYEIGLEGVYNYDGFGNRVGKTEGKVVGSVTLGKKFDSMDLNPCCQIEDVIDLTKHHHNLLQRNEDEMVTTFTWDNDVLSVTSDEGLYNYFQDDLGSTLRVLDETGESQVVYGYDEFGKDLYGNQGCSQPFGFTGYQKNKLTGTYFAQAREYCPAQGRFTGEDLIKGSERYPWAMNAYIYCWNRPLDLVDFNGLSPTSPEELTVFLDPGHGGEDDGAIGYRNTRPNVIWWPIGANITEIYKEKDMNLQLALLVKDSLESKGVTVYMSRTSDIKMEPQARADLANETGADLFVSIHHNSSNPFKRGTQVLYPGIEEHGVRAVDSKAIAEIVNSLVLENTKLKDLGIIERPNLWVLNQTHMLAILTETGYMGGDIKLISNEAHMQLVADNIANGIIEGLLEYYDQECIE